MTGRRDKASSQPAGARGKPKLVKKTRRKTLGNAKAGQGRVGVTRNKAPPLVPNFDDRYYMLDEENRPVAAPDVLTWAKWLSTRGGNRHVAYDALPGGVTVSTIFLGVNHNFMDRGPPVLWETMILGGAADRYQERYSSLKEAAAGHKRAVALARGTGRRSRTFKD
jgi:hypothetical protein